MANEPALYARMEMRVKDAEKQLAKFAQRLDGEATGMERRWGKATKNMDNTMSRGLAKMVGYLSNFGKGLWAGIAAGGFAGITVAIQNVAKSAVEKEKMIALRHAGAAATEAEKQKINSLVESTYRANEAHEKQKQALQELNDAGRDFAGTLVDGLLSGAKASDVLSNALGQLADRFLNSGLDALFGGGGIGGIFGSVFGGGKSDPWAGLRLASGGHVRGPGGPRSDSIPAMLSNGEYVINAAAAKKFGPLLDAINGGRGLALAGGGPVSLPSITAPRMPDLSRITNTNNNSVNSAPVININVTGASGDDHVRSLVRDGVRQGLSAYDKGSVQRTALNLRQVSSRGLAK